MILLRGLLLLLMLVSAISFAFGLTTRQAYYHRFGWLVLKWTLVVAFCFFAILIAERVV